VVIALLVAVNMSLVSAASVKALMASSESSTTYLVQQNDIQAQELELIIGEINSAETPSAIRGRDESP
jgi:hypothetical protein